MRRDVIGSELWRKPPLYHRTFSWLQMMASYGRELSLRDIAEGVAWWENNRLLTPAPLQIKRILEHLLEIGWIEWTPGTGNSKSTIKVVPLNTYKPSPEAVRCAAHWHEQRPLPEAIDVDVYHKVFDDLNSRYGLSWGRIGDLVQVVLDKLDRLRVPSQLMGKSKSRPELRVWQTVAENMGERRLTTDGHKIAHEDATTITLSNGEVRVKR